MKRIFAIILLTCFSLGIFAETWKITSLDWEPYSSQKLPENGAGIYALKEVLKKVGVKLNVEFLPWQRAQKKAKDDPKVIGYYPAWPEEVAEGFFGSVPVFNSPLVIVEMKSKPIKWNKFEDFAGFTISVVKDYGYPPELWELINAGKIRANLTNSDDTSLKQLVTGRCDYTPVDLYVMKYYMSTDHSLKPYERKVAANKKIVDIKDLLIAFEDSDPKNKQRAEKLKEALRKIKVDKVLKRYFDTKL